MSDGPPIRMVPPTPALDHAARWSAHCRLRDVVAYMDSIGIVITGGRGSMSPNSLLDAAERNGSVDAARRQVMLALLLDGKLDAAATVPAG
jgi:hypothetical protein